MRPSFSPASDRTHEHTQCSGTKMRFAFCGGPETVNTGIHAAFIPKDRRCVHLHARAKPFMTCGIRNCKAEKRPQAKTLVWAVATPYFGRICRPNVLPGVATAQTLRVMSRVVHPRFARCIITPCSVYYKTYKPQSVVPIRGPNWRTHTDKIWRQKIPPNQGSIRMAAAGQRSV